MVPVDMQPRRDLETPRKDYPFDVDPTRPVFKQGVTLTANQEREYALPSTRVLFVNKLVSFGTAPGEISIALGERGEFFELAGGDEIHLSQFTVIRFRNNTALTKQCEVLHSNDPNFSFRNYNRGV